MKFCNSYLFQIIFSPLVTMDPRKWPRRTFNAAFSTTRATMKLPLQIRDELKAIKELRNTGRVMYPHTLTWKYGELAQLWVRATLEAWRGLVEAYRSPGKFWTDTVGADDGQRHLLQTVNLCGRKVGVLSIQHFCVNNLYSASSTKTLKLL